jgi:outer membrane protein TolC
MTELSRRAGTLASLVVTALASSPAGAMTLDEALRSALASNPVLAGKIVDVRIADAHVLQAAGLDDFVVSGGATWSRSRGPNVAAQQTALSPYDAVDANATLTRPLATGGSVAVTLDAPYTRVASALTPGAPGDVGPIQAYQPSAQLAITQPLLRGRGYDVARAPQRQARALRDVAGWDMEDAATGLARDVSLAYWELAYQSGDHELRIQSLEAARAQLRAVAAQIDVGKQPPSASFEVEVSIAQREDEAIDSEGQIDARAADLARLLGPEEARMPRSIVATDRPPAYATLASAVARALERNPTIASLHARAGAATIDVDVARSALLPQLDASLSGGPMGVATSAPAAFRSLSSLGGYTAQATLVFQEPVERRAGRGARDAAVETVQRARLDESDARALVASEVAIETTALNSTARRIELLERAARTAALDVESETARFQANRSTSFDVLRRQQALTDVLIQLLREEVDNAKAAATMDALTDDILLRHGLAVAAPRGMR